MKTLHISIITIVGIAVILLTSLGIFIEKLNDNPEHPYTSIAITGLKENYTLNEPIVFSVVLEGYGKGCGYVNETIAKDDQQIYSTFGSGTPCIDHPNYFKFNTGSSSTTANLLGNYTLRASFYDIVTFQHTSTKKNFSIILPLNHTVDKSSVIVSIENQTHHIIDVVYIQRSREPANPGGPKIQIMLKNNSAESITNLKAILELNNSYVFNFNATKSQPLIPGDSLSDTEILIGGGFTTESQYPLIVSGIANDIPFSYTVNVKIG